LRDASVPGGMRQNSYGARKQSDGKRNAASSGAQRQYAIHDMEMVSTKAGE
jgi:hypothetical protein